MAFRLTQQYSPVTSSTLHKNWQLERDLSSRFFSVAAAGQGWGGYEDRLAEQRLQGRRRPAEPRRCRPAGGPRPWAPWGSGVSRKASHVCESHLLT